MNQRWLWYAIDHYNREVLAFVFGKRNDDACRLLKNLLEPFGTKKYYTDDWSSYTRYFRKRAEIGKRNTQRIERKNLTLKTRLKRLVRKTICFSKSELIRDTVIGIFINQYEFGRIYCN